MLGQSVSHFEVLEKVGEGGMGAVYKARDIRLDRLVALKFLSPARVPSRVERRRMFDEARALSKLSHPNVATLHEMDEVDDTPFIALEYLPGGTLRARIEAAHGNLPVPHLLRWAGDLAEGLAHAHRHGIVHRDVKSSNVMFDAEDHVKLTDFGLARSTADDSTREGTVTGTIGYIAPEQLEGKCADFQSDLFSLGVVLYEAATGRMPFRGESHAETIRNVLTADPVPVTALRPELPVEFETIVERLLRKRPEERYQSSTEVAQRIRAAAAPSTSAPTETLPVAVARKSRRWWIAAALACLLLLGLAAGGSVKRWVRSWGLPARKYVAVLPFRSIGGDAGQQAFCDGLTETVTTALTRLGSFSVVPPTDARRFENADAARREFGVNLVIAGTVQRRGDSIRVVIHLIDAANRAQIGSEPLDVPEKRLFEVEDNVLGKMADLLNVLSSGQPANLLAASASQLPNAHDAYMRGRGFLYRHDRAGNLDQAVREFETAIRQDPRFALAYVGLAEAHFRRYSALGDRGILESAQLAAQRSLELNAQLASGHTWHGRILAEQGQQDEALRELQAAVRLDPNDPAGYRELARVYQMQSRPEEAERVFKQAIAARPGDWGACSDLAAFYNSRQRYLESEAQYRRVLELTPDNPSGYRNLAVILIRLGKNREAEAMLRKALDLRPGARTYSNLGALLMYERRYADAVPVMEKAAEVGLREAPKEYRIWGNLGDACWLAKLPKERASSAWRRAVEIAEPQLTGKPSDADLLSLLANYHSKLADKAAASRRITEALLLAPSSAVVHYQAGLVFALLGEEARSVSELAAAINLKYSIDEIRQAPELFTLHQNPEFQKLIAH